MLARVRNEAPTETGPEMICLVLVLPCFCTVGESRGKATSGACGPACAAMRLSGRALERALKFAGFEYAPHGSEASRYVGLGLEHAGVR